MAQPPAASDLTGSFSPHPFSTRLLTGFAFRAEKIKHVPTVKFPLLFSWASFSRISDYCQIFFSTLKWVPGATLLFFKSWYNDYSKRIHRIAPAVTFDLSKNEDKLLAAFEWIKLHPVYPLLVPIARQKISFCNDLSDNQKAFQFLKSHFSQNLSHGITFELIYELSLNPQSSPADLLAFIDIQYLFFYEMISQMKIALLTQKTHLAVKYRLGRVMAEPPMENVVEKIKVDLEKIDEAYQKLQLDLPSQESELFKANQPIQTYQNILRRLLSSRVEIKGSILILLPDSLGKMSQSVGHSIFFQCLPGRFQFYNGIPTEGFFTYTNETNFLESLREQILSIGPDTTIQFSVSF